MEDLTHEACWNSNEVNFTFFLQRNKQTAINQQSGVKRLQELSWAPPERSEQDLQRRIHGARWSFYTCDEMWTMSSSSQADIALWVSSKPIKMGQGRLLMESLSQLPQECGGLLLKIVMCGGEGAQELSWVEF